MTAAAVYVNSDAVPYASLILSGAKPIETRTRDVLGRFVGKRVLIIRSGRKPAEIVGSVRITRSAFCSASALDAIRGETLIPAGSQYDCIGAGKWCYFLEDPEQFADPIPLKAVTVESKTRSYAIISF